ncbi:GTP-binding protein of the rab/ypt [Coemansia nantahalensis]|uniref:GTP-binding protein of the rab/ypt n=1 Tax=Coemansia nantahalensis TaxID=2789366 RepID=A0ACC1K986_9FUNG|nr:GTP-binding protein of the rab/ypt [Coemansia nantahalensis]KAJ2775889.1 GTP-binding protein of the rab/ypt [Coemansia nantahalensis]
MRFARNEFNQYNESTIGAAFVSKDVELDAANTAQLRIWDTAGQERFKSLAPMYYRGAEGAVVAYDITQAPSFDKAKAWITEVQRQNEGATVIALVGNKVDLDAKRTVSKEEGAAYAAEAGVLFFETSAQSGHGVAQVFEQLARKIPLPPLQPPAGRTGQPSINVHSADADGTAAADCAC